MTAEGAKIRDDSRSLTATRIRATRCRLRLAISALVIGTACRPPQGSEVDAAKVEPVANNRVYGVNVVELQPGWGNIQVSARAFDRKPLAITGCIGDFTACEAGTARSFILYADPAVIAASANPGPIQLAGRADNLGAPLQFPFPVSFQQPISFNIATYYAPVQILNGWIVATPGTATQGQATGTATGTTTKSDSTELGNTVPVTNQSPTPGPAGSQTGYADQLQKGLAALRELPSGTRTIESVRISVDWTVAVLSSVLQQAGQVIPQQPNNPSPGPSPYTPSNPLPNQPYQPQPGGPVDLTGDKILDQGATNYCWGYSAFHMLRAFYFKYEPNGAWAQAIGRINSDSGMASHMRANHANQGSNMQVWIEKFMSLNPNLPDHGWDWKGGISDAARKLQQTPAIPSSYCDGRHCTALIGFSGGQFTVADSAGGYTYKASPGEIGEESTVSLNNSDAAKIVAQQPQINPLPGQLPGQPGGVINPLSPGQPQPTPGGIQPQNPDVLPPSPILPQ